MSDRPTLSHERMPSGWGEAFAAMPAEAPDADAWPGIARAAWSHRRRPAWPALAAAAALAVVVVLPWRLATEPETRTATPMAARTVPAPAATARATNADVAQADTRAVDVSPGGRDAATGAEGVASPASPDDGMPNAQQRVATAEPVRRDSAVQVATASVAQADDAAAHATNAPPRLAIEADADEATSADTSASGSELEQLYAESAQLEALVTMARNNRVATTGTAAALASQYDAQVAEIDARLVALSTSQPDVTPEERARLWRARVAALRELAGFESTQRLLAAHGERYDAMLVSID